jgi:predicted ester cyclase
MSEKNKALVRRYYEDVLNGRHADVFDELADPRFISHLPNGEGVDIRAYRQAIAASLAAMPDLKVHVEDQIAEGDKVTTRLRATGTPLVPFGGIQPNGQPITVSAIHIHRIQGGKLIEHWEAINLHAIQPGA